MWLLRGLSFTCKGLQHAQADPSAELAPAFTKSYEQTLKAFHNFIVKGVFSVRSPILCLKLCDLNLLVATDRSR